jgi:hypothetical protein
VVHAVRINTAHVQLKAVNSYVIFLSFWELDATVFQTLFNPGDSLLPNKSLQVTIVWAHRLETWVRSLKEL